MDSLTQSLLELTLALIERPSVTPEDAGCQKLLGNRLRQQGFAITDLPFGDVQNLWATRGSGAPLFLFAGHTDVVPTGPVDAWRTPPFTATLEDGMLRGRGSADMKGSLAAMVCATEAFVAAHPDHPGTLAYLLTSDEEGPAVDGTRRVVEYLSGRAIRPDYCVVGEPSSKDRLGDVIRVGRRGSLNALMRINGRQGHVAYPETVDNPIHRAAPLLATLAATRWDSGNPEFPPTSFQITNIHAGTGATNVVPGTLEVLFNLRFSTEQTAEGLQARITSLCRDAGLDFDIEWSLSGNPFLTRGGRLLAAAGDSIESIQGFRPEHSTGGGTSDGRFIAPMGSELIELGPVNATIHQVDEQVSLADLHRLCRIYQDLLERLLLGTGPACTD
ncbi:MAG: succinyl-diaminopimelate desuccinylase [Pseudomonadales bacterium]